MKQANIVLKSYEKKDLEDRLMTDFKEALNDEDFALLVSKLKLPYEKLCKYTSLLEDSKVEYSHCLHCKSILECKNKVEGHAYLPDQKDGKLTFIYKPCKYMLKQEKAFAYLKNITCSNMPEEIKRASFKDISLKDSSRLPVIEALTQFTLDYREHKKVKGLYLHGNFGSGKTYLICAMMNELAKNGVKSYIAFWPEFLTELKASFGCEDFSSKLNQVKKSPILLIDDIGAENTTPWSRDDVLCPILQYRMQEGLPTFFTSNFTLDELESHLSISKDGVEEVKAKRILERIKQLSVDLSLESKNLRK